MTTVFTSQRFEDHDPGRHPENPQRIAVLREMLNARSNDPQRPPFSRGEVASADLNWMNAVHPRPYVDSVRKLCLQGGGRLDADTIASEESFEVALLAAGTACSAVRQVVEQTAHNALCLIRPPGHHALADHAMGFCLFNNVAIAARFAQSEFDLDRVLIIDWDVHHGNGTQDIFYNDETVTFCSIHRFPFYPGSGAADETGHGRGLGFTFNEPIAYGTSRDEFLKRFDAMIQRAADKAKPDLILISAGFDAHLLDPIGSLELESEDFGRLTDSVKELADQHCQGRVVSLLEGGYHPDALAESVSIHLDHLIDDKA